jgi:hypothetical protein
VIELRKEHKFHHSRPMRGRRQNLRVRQEHDDH